MTSLIFNAYPYVKQPDRESEYVVMCDADNVSLEAVLIAHVGRGYVIAAEEERVAVLLGDAECYLSKMIWNKQVSATA